MLRRALSILLGAMASPDPLRLAASMRAHRQALRGARGCHCYQGIGGCPWQQAGARGGNSATACRHPIASCSCHRFALNLNCTHGYWESSLLRAATNASHTPFTPSRSCASLGWGCNLNRLHALLHILQRAIGWDRRRHIQTQPRQPQHSAALDRIGSTKRRTVGPAAAAVANWTKECRHFIPKASLD